jgi:hypothetical protein
MDKQVIDTKLVMDAISNVVTTTAQFGEPLPTVIVPYIASDLLYSKAIKTYIDNNYGGNEGLTDDLSREIVVKTALTGVVIWLSQTFTGQGVGLLEGTLNALVSYSASNGIQDILDI